MGAGPVIAPDGTVYVTSADGRYAHFIGTARVVPRKTFENASGDAVRLSTWGFLQLFKFLGI